jgi:hypothetical protein
VRFHLQGDCYRVTVSESEVYAFARRWPCSGLPGCGVSFTFDRLGDLVDVVPDVDGEAVSALADDAKAYAATRMERRG